MGAIEDKRKLRMQEELFQKHGQKLIDKQKEKAGEAGPSRKFKKKKKLDPEEPKRLGRGARQRARKRAEKAEAEEKSKQKAVNQETRAKSLKRRVEERIAERPKKPPGKRHEPDAGFAAS